MAAIAQHAKDADLFICEGMYGEPEKSQKAVGYKHMTFVEAAAAGEAGSAEGDVADALQSVACTVRKTIWRVYAKFFRAHIRARTENQRSWISRKNRYTENGE